jgi:Domain of unknown function (DUF4160)
VPTVLRIGPYRFFFYSNENDEPVHVHIQRDRAVAKFWLSPISYASSTSFSASELSRILKLVEENQEVLKEAWNEFFNN